MCVEDGADAIGRALKQLGIEHIAAYSPQARGQSERVFGTVPRRITTQGIRHLMNFPGESSLPYQLLSIRVASLIRYEGGLRCASARSLRNAPPFHEEARCQTCLYVYEQDWHYLCARGASSGDGTRRMHVLRSVQLLQLL